MSLEPKMKVEIKAEYGDITTFSADVVVLKFAQEFYGADAAVAMSLADYQKQLMNLSPAVGKYSIVATDGKIDAKYALFVGVPSLFLFGYGQIRDFSKRAMEILSAELPDTQHVAMTIHGVGYGLDEVESLLSQLGGLLDAFRVGHIPPILECITIVERNQRRANRLQQIIEEGVSSYRLFEGEERVLVPVSRHPIVPSIPIRHIPPIDETGVESDAKPHIFVAMPFSEETDDIYSYGIQRPVHAAGYLCERVDLTSFTGDILERIRSRIETATLVIADLTGANPNVYLEVGYAWGKNRPTILLVRSGEELKFDVRGQRCITYRKILDLEKTLERELRGLSKDKLARNDA
jgi:hypothetical protein